MPPASPLETTHVSLLGVDYLHLHTREGGELYVTKFGTRHLEHLQPENWRESKWFRANRTRLEGTSTVYRLSTKEVDGRSIDMVVKYSRVGEDVPLDTMTFERFWNAEFNSPYEEFSLLMEMREDPSPGLLLTNRPLAIYVPPERMKLWQTGRTKHRIARKTSKFRDVELDICRQYILIYQWVKGESAPEALQSLVDGREEFAKKLQDLTRGARDDMAAKGFMVIDHKPAHVILRPKPDGTLLRRRSGKPAYALVDFELLSRTPKHEKDVKVSRREDYFRHIGHRFAPPAAAAFPEHLHPANIFGIDYVFGHAESTGGSLWVVGKDPHLFDFFLPERWRHTPSDQMSKAKKTFYTVSKDGIHIVWKVSSVGERLRAGHRNPATPGRGSAGYNSPFEEFLTAEELGRRGVSCVSPRAIYMAGLESRRAADHLSDNSRYESHGHLRTPEGDRVLRPDHNYISIWGFWRGFGNSSPGSDEPDYEGINLRRARQRGLVSSSLATSLIHRTEEQLKNAGFVSEKLKPSHLLLSLQPDGALLKDPDGYPTTTIANCERLRRID